MCSEIYIIKYLRYFLLLFSHFISGTFREEIAAGVVALPPAERGDLPGRLHDDGLHPRGGAAPHAAAALAAAQHRTGRQDNINTYFALMVYFLFGIISLNLLRHASNRTFYVCNRIHPPSFTTRPSHNTRQNEDVPSASVGERLPCGCISPAHYLTP